MQEIRLEATDTTPAVTFDPQDGVLQLSGRSIPENATRFYYPLLDWLKEYSSNPAPNTQLDFYLEYINSISQKMVVEILHIAKEMRESEHPVEILWRHDRDDEEMQEEGEVFSQKFDLDITIMAVEE